MSKAITKLDNGMTITKLNDAITEARRFIKRAEAAKSRAKAGGHNDCGWMWGTKETGAARRASMDLTRSLAELRK